MASEYDYLIGGSETWRSALVPSDANVEDDDRSDEAALERSRGDIAALSELIDLRGNVGTIRFWNGVNTLRNLSEQHHIRYLDQTGGQFSGALTNSMMGQFVTVSSFLDIYGGDELQTYDPALQEKFDRLARRWNQETHHLSSVTDIVLNFNYQQIIGMGPDALPLIFGELERQGGGHWFWALRAITGIDPVDVADRGSVPKMTAAWLDWWHKQV